MFKLLNNLTGGHKPLATIETKRETIELPVLRISPEGYESLAQRQALIEAEREADRLWW